MCPCSKSLFKAFFIKNCHITKKLKTSLHVFKNNSKLSYKAYTYILLLQELSNLSQNHSFSLKLFKTILSSLKITVFYQESF